MKERFTLAGPCPQCGKPMRDYHGMMGSSPYRMSRDHIRPREWGGTVRTYGDTRNVRVMCQDCNGLIAACGHCAAAAACVRDVARQTGARTGAVLSAWEMYRHQPRKPTVMIRREKPRDQPAVYPRGEFIYPAVSAAARVWNLATLSKIRGAEP